MQDRCRIGIVGGSGQLGGAIARAWLRSDRVAPENLWISNRSGTDSGFENWPGMTFTKDNQALSEACDVILLAVPPDRFAALTVKAPDRLVLSVIAGVTSERLQQKTGSPRIVRVMSSPAAEDALAFTAWQASPAVTQADKDEISSLFEACGEVAELPGEDQIDLFTALTGPVPGFVAFFAACMANYAVDRGIDAYTADRAVRQLFKASGLALSDQDSTPEAQVQAMIDYAGTTATGLKVMKGSPLCASIEEALDASVAKARKIAQGD